MIAKITGVVSDIRDDAITLDNSGMGHEVLVPRGLALRLRTHGAAGTELTLHTLEYIEGGAAGGAMIPRLIGFLDPMDREFFGMLTSVKGLGPRKALRSLTIPTRRFALAIEEADKAALSELPGVGRRSSEKIIAELRGKCHKFGLMREGEPLGATPEEKLAPDVRAETVQILTEQLQYSPAEAEAMIRQALAGDKEVESSQELLSEIYRIRAEGD